MNKYLKAFPPGSQVITKVIMVVIMLGFLSGCLHDKSGIVKTVTNINHLREAQTAFNESAMLENKSRTGGLNPFTDSAMKAEVGNTMAIQNGYASALISISKIYPSEKEQLASDKVLGHILFLKAMAQWRIGNFEGALDTADAAVNEAGDQLYPRDAAVLTALPGLIKTDLAYTLIQKIPGIKEHLGDKEKLENYLVSNRLILKEDISDDVLNNENKLNEKLIENIRSRLVSHKKNKDAVNDIMTARKKVDKKHEVNLYLIQAQLSAYRNYQVAHQFTSTDNADPLSDDDAKKQAQYNLYDLEKLLEALKKSESPSPVAYWTNLCRIRPAKRP